MPPTIGPQCAPLLRTTLGDTTMAKGKSTRNADGSPSSLTSLLSGSSPLAIPSPPVTPLDDPVILNQLNHGRYDDPVSDRRRYHPEGRYRPATALIKDAARVVVGKEPHSLLFNLPNIVAICVRRKTRREVLFALDRHHRKGSGGGRRKPRKRNNYSGIKC